MEATTYHIHPRCARRIVFAAVLALALAASGCSQPDSMAAIKASGTLVVLSSNSFHGVYYYQDDPRGFEYELCKAFADYLGVRLHVLTPPLEKRMAMLEKGKAYMVAAGLHATDRGSEHLDYSVPYRQVTQHVVVNRFNRGIHCWEDLAGRMVHVRRGGFFEYLLRARAGQAPSFTLVAHSEGGQEFFLEDVHSREIEATVADEHVALMARRRHPDLVLAFPLEGKRPLAWAVKKGDARLLEKMNKFLLQAKADGTVDRLWNKYYKGLEDFDYLDLKRFHRRLKTRLPRYRDAIVQAARENGFDWRLIAAVTYQESHFNPRAESYTGVRGLMQLTETTAEEMGVTDRLDPKQNILAGVAYLRKLYDRFKDIPEPDRMLFTLAAYNVGYGHVQDARNLASDQGMDPNSWSAVSKTLPLLRLRKYYRNTTYGYCRGTEPVRYVNRVLTYYDILTKKAVILRRV
ncbi:MAG: membrane-bound lytic murein transglycosylase MltF [Deltaproteobacteria bacterium]|nr:membrane-bound lytic murein transglycosylase MltF [Deltaproteobacteria bacterium]